MMLRAYKTVDYSVILSSLRSQRSIMSALFACAIPL
jgi:hypothetical protein